MRVSAFLLLFSVSVAGANEPFPGAPPGAAAFDTIMGDHPCEMTYRGPEGELNQTAKCRWNWFYKFEGRMVQDDFMMFGDDGNPIFAGTTIRTWDLAENRWNNLFLDVHGRGDTGVFYGNPVDDEIHLTLDGQDAAGKPYTSRIIFSDISGGTFKWRQERSYDDGETWMLWIKTEVFAP